MNPNADSLEAEPGGMTDELYITKAEKNKNQGYKQKEPKDQKPKQRLKQQNKGQTKKGKVQIKH